MLACIAVGWKLPKPERFTGFSGVMLRLVTPALIVVIGLFGALDIIFPAAEGDRAFSSNGFAVVVIACAIVGLCALAYQLFLKNRDTGSNADEEQANALRREKMSAGLRRGWQRPE